MSHTSASRASALIGRSKGLRVQPISQALVAIGANGISLRHLSAIALPPIARLGIDERSTVTVDLAPPACLKHLIH